MSKTRILFVDDEANILDGLRRMLRGQRNEWDMVFVSCAADALARMAEAPIDVIVTDVQMPGMNGVELLERIVTQYPGVARIILTSHTDEAKATRVVKLVHQFLSKPTDAETLKLAVTRACAASSSGPASQVRAIATSLGTLPSAPELYVQLSKLAASEGTNAHDIGRVIARDPAVCAKVLQLVNSSFFGLGRRVSSIEQAVSLLGVKRIKTLVLSSQITEEFRPARPVPGFSAKTLLRRSTITAEYAQAICRAEGLDKDRQDQAFSAGLLHDVGLLVLASRKVEVLEEALERVHSAGTPLCDTEFALLGGTHAEVGACLLELWNLPPRIVEGVALHHSPASSQFNGISSVTTVHAAAALLREVPVANPEGEEERAFMPSLDLDYLRTIGRAERIEQWRQLIPAAASNPEAIPV
jgi:HD-like signal output (HDOD) protein